MSNLRNRSESKPLIVAGVLAILAIALSIYAHSLPYFPGDLSLTVFIQSLDGNALLSVMKWASFAFEGWRAYALVIVIGIVVWWKLGKLRAALAVSAGLSTTLNAALKIAVDRPRPAADLIQVHEVELSGSFPSGHAFFVTVVLGLAAYFAFTYIRNPALRTASVAIPIILIMLTGISRIYLGAHWPSDVLGGYLAGASVLGTLIWLDKMFSRKRANPPN